MNPQIIVEYLAKTDKLNAGVKDLASSGSKAKAAVGKAFLPAVAVLGAVGLAAGKALDAASSLSEQISRSGVVFGENAAAIQDWSKGAAKNFGLSRTEALNAASSFGTLLKTSGFAGNETAAMSKKLVELAGDLGSFNDVDPAIMLDKLRAGLSGEAEPLKQFIGNIDEATTKAYAYANGIAEAGKPLTEAQKMQARYGLILERSADAQGDYARTADGVANSQRTAAKQTEDLSASIGTSLLPVTKLFLGVLTDVMGFFQRYPGVLKAVIIGVTLLAAAIVALNIALTVATLIASPYILIILAVVAAIAALIAVGVLVVKNWDKISAALAVAWDGITNAAKSAVDQVVGAFKRLASIVTGIVSGFLSWVRSNWQTLLVILTGPIGLAVVLVAKYWDQISDAARSAVSAIKSVWSGLSSFISSTVSSIVGFLSRLVSALGGPADAARDAASAVKSAIGKIPGYIEDIIGRVRSAAASVASAIKAPINAVLSAWGNASITLPRITLPKIPLPGGDSIGGGSYGGQSFHFPRPNLLAKGGILDSPTLFIGGEAGREIVTPENLLREIVGEGGGDSFTLNLYVRDADPAAIAYGFRRLELLRTGR